jgi:hypothetical protein
MLWLRRTFETERSPFEAYELLNKYTEPNKYRVQMYSEALFIGTVKEDRFKAVPNKLFAKSRWGANVTVSGRLKKTDTGTKIVAWARPLFIYQLLFFVIYLLSFLSLSIDGSRGVITLVCLVSAITVMLFGLFYFPIRNGLRDVQTVLDKRR